MNWHEKSVQETIFNLRSNEETGLSEKDISILKEQYGENLIEDTNKTSIVKKFFLQFNDFMILILLVAAGVSFIMSFADGSSFADSIIILAVVIVNALLGVFQEYKAEKSIEALKELSSPQALVIRDSKTISISTKELVLGDIIMLKAGDLVPADCRLISSQNLKSEESALTGESVPVEKDHEKIIEANAPIGDRHNMVFFGSTISYGRAKAIVTDTGMGTQMGKIAEMIAAQDPDTPLQKRLRATGKILGIGVLFICAIIFVMGFFNDIPMFEMFMTSVSLAVAAIPEGLPTIVTIVLAIGVSRMAKRKAVIRKLPAVETLGSANVICSDKTGTLTQNKMRVTEIRDINGTLPNKNEDRKSILKYVSLCNDSIVNETSGDLNVQGEPTETALIVEAFSEYVSKSELDKSCPRVEELPFDSKRKLMSTIHKWANNKYMVITKGAPDILIEKCTHYYDNGKVLPLNDKEKRMITVNNTDMAEQALRVLAVAFREDSHIPPKDVDKIENNLVFAGLIGMMDPPRAEVKDAVKVCKEAGIKPVMVTGDHLITAKAIAKKIGIMDNYDNAMTGAELSKISDEELTEKIMDYAVFARVSPEDKVRIVKAHQTRGNVVAMTGDGVNDAPALKSANIGCAMGITGTDVAKGAADMVLLDDNFATIVEAVREGRGIYENIKKAIHFLLATNVGEIIIILMAMILRWDTPILAIHLLWINLVTDSLPAIALGLDPVDEDIMKRKPLNPNKSFFGDGAWQRIAIEGIMGGIVALIAFLIGVRYFDLAIARTMCFTTLGISEMVHAFNMRSKKSIFDTNMFNNLYLYGAFAIGAFLQVIIVLVPPFANIFRVVPLNAMQWVTVIGLCLVPIVVVEIEKFVIRLYENKKENRVGGY